jgi:hypothetical protein
MMGIETKVFHLQEGMSQAIGHKADIAQSNPIDMVNKHVSTTSILTSCFNFLNTCGLQYMISKWEFVFSYVMHT